MQHNLLINNEWCAAAAGNTMDVVNPATEEVIAQVPSASAADLDQAVAAARAALDGPWGQMSARERGRLVRKLGERLLERADEVSRLVQHMIENVLLNGEVVRLDGALRMAPR